jgi:hypothetical protein
VVAGHVRTTAATPGGAGGTSGRHDGSHRLLSERTLPTTTA